MPDTDVTDAPKVLPCEFCGADNPEWVSECEACAACVFCGQVLPTDADPGKTFDLRQPHRLTHEGQA